MDPPSAKPIAPTRVPLLPKVTVPVETRKFISVVLKPKVEVGTAPIPTVVPTAGIRLIPPFPITEPPKLILFAVIVTTPCAALADPVAPMVKVLPVAVKSMFLSIAITAWLMVKPPELEINEIALEELVRPTVFTVPTAKALLSV